MKRMTSICLGIVLLTSSTGCALIGDLIISNLEHEDRDTRLNSNNMTDSQRAKRYKADFLRNQDHREQFEGLR